jgi:site-specific DNA-methyltransferase (adenine-specific)
MPPALARHLITSFSSRGDLILDPFCGKGTVLLEALLLQRKCLGFDVAPDCIIVSNAKIQPPPLTAVERMLHRFRPQPRTLSGIPPEVGVFYSPKTLSQLLELRDFLLARARNGTSTTRRAANFLMATLLGVLHGHSKLSLSLPCSHSFAMAPNYVRQYARKHHLRRPVRNVQHCLLERAKQLLASKPPDIDGRAVLCSADAYPRSLRDRLVDSVDLIVTSPPYLNVQTYAKDSWLRLWLLGYEYRALRSRFIETGSPRVYSERMKPCLAEMLKVLKPSKYAVIVAGDAPRYSKGKRSFFRTAEELASLASDLTHGGFTFRTETMFVDSIPAHARYYSAVHKDGRQGTRLEERKGVHVERIVVLKKVPAP